jgi:hypothetical protein
MKIICEFRCLAIRTASTCQRPSIFLFANCLVKEKILEVCPGSQLPELRLACSDGIDGERPVTFYLPYVLVSQDAAIIGIFLASLSTGVLWRKAQPPHRPVGRPAQPLPLATHRSPVTGRMGHECATDAPSLDNPERRRCLRTDRAPSSRVGEGEVHRLVALARDTVVQNRDCESGSDLSLSEYDRAGV